MLYAFSIWHNESGEVRASNVTKDNAIEDPEKPATIHSNASLRTERVSRFSFFNRMKLQNVCDFSMAYIFLSMICMFFFFPFQIKLSITSLSLAVDVFKTILLLCELHMLKVLFIYAFYISLADVSALQFFIVVLATFACASKMRTQVRLYGTISLVMGVLMLAKMIYQVHTVPTNWGLIECDVSIFGWWFCVCFFLIGFIIA